MLDTLFLSVLNMSITAGIVILVVLPVRLLLRRAPKIFSYALWAVVLFRLLCPFSFESVIGLLPGDKKPIPQDIVFSTEPQLNTGLPIADQAVNPMLPIKSNAGESVNPLQIWVFAGSVIWAAGIIVMLLYTMVQLVLLRRKVIGAALLRDNIYIADYADSPFAMGFITPKIYLPSSMEPAEKKYILAHEQCHIRRWDHITRVLAFTALTIHWFNLLVWLAFVLSGKDMEMSCDEAVMKRMDFDIRAEYSQSLLRFAAGRKRITGTPLAFGESDIKGRIKNVMQYKKPMFWVSAAAIIAVICVTARLMSHSKTESKAEPKEESLPVEAEQGSLQRLWENRTEYVGNNAAVGNILSELSFPDNIHYKNFELKTKMQPYEIIIHFEAEEEILKMESNDKQTEIVTNVRNIDSAQLERNVRVMFALIGNVEKITFSLSQKDGGAFTSSYMRNEYEEYFANTAAYEGFQTVFDKIFFDKESNTPASDAKTDASIPENITYDEAVVLALTSRKNSFLEGECFAEGHIILGSDDSSADKTKIYALSMIGWYGFENNRFVKVSGSGVVPVVVTLDRSNKVEAEYPLDGGDYNASIRELFPEEYHARIFGHTDADHESLKKQEQKYAEEYLAKIGRDAKIEDEDTPMYYTLLTDAGVSVEVSNNLEVFYKAHSYYPSFIGTCERLENDVRMVYEMSYHENEDEIRFTKYKYDTKETVEQFVVNAKTGEMK